MEKKDEALIQSKAEVDRLEGNCIKYYFKLKLNKYLFSLYIAALASSLLELTNKDKENEKGKETIKELDVIISKTREENKGTSNYSTIILSYFFPFTNINRSCS